ncbi:MAG TPA: aminotransferase class IV [Opitutaceae bacterium]
MKRVIDGLILPASPFGPDHLPDGVAGVFETVLLRAGEPVFFADHWERFSQGCRWCGLVEPTAAEEMKGYSAMLAEANGVRSGVLRFATWRRDDGSIGWRIDVDPPRPHMAQAMFRVNWGPALPPADENRAFKHLDRGPWLAALRASRAAGWDEVLLRDTSGKLVEGGVTNVFFVRDGRMHTPALECGPLPGIMRARVLELARASGLKVREGRFDATDVTAATEVWLTNSLIGIRPVTLLADRPFATVRPVLDRLRKAWRGQYGWDPVVISH